MNDDLYNLILDIVNECPDIYSTPEIMEILASKYSRTDATRAKVFYRLTILLGNKKIHGRIVGGSGGIWIWWKRRTRKTRDGGTREG